MEKLVGFTATNMSTLSGDLNLSQNYVAVDDQGSSLITSSKQLHHFDIIGLYYSFSRYADGRGSSHQQQVKIFAAIISGP